MKNKRNIRKKLRFLSLLLLVSSISFATMAYYTDYEKLESGFTDVTDPLSSKGAIDITLTEPSWDALLEKFEAEKSQIPELPIKNELYLKPGAKYPKDPTVTVLKDNTDAYVFMSLDHNMYVDGVSMIEKIVISLDWIDITDEHVQVEMKNAQPNKKVYMYVGAPAVKLKEFDSQRYLKTSKKDISLTPLFKEIKINTTIDNVLSEEKAYAITTEAYAHQATTEDFTDNKIIKDDVFVSALSAAIAKFYE